MTIQVTIADVRAAGICMKGARGFLARQGVPWPQFLEQGVSAEMLLATQDPFAARAVEAARVRCQQKVV